MKPILGSDKSRSELSALAAVVIMLTAGILAKSGAPAFLLHLSQ